MAEDDGNTDQPGYYPWNGRGEAIIAHARTRAREGLLRQWNLLRSQYPQLTKGTYLNVLSDRAIKRLNGPNYNAAAFGGVGHDPTDPQHRQGIVANADYLRDLPTAVQRFILAKELGQNQAESMVGTNHRGDELMDAWGYRGPRDQRTSGLEWDWNGNTGNLGHGSRAVTVEGATSQPLDVYGTQFAAALGIGERGNHRMAPPVMQHLQNQGILPHAQTDPARQQMMAAYMARLASVKRPDARPTPIQHGPARYS